MLCSFFSNRFFSRTADLSSGVDVVHAAIQWARADFCVFWDPS